MFMVQMHHFMHEFFFFFLTQSKLVTYEGGLYKAKWVQESLGTKNN